MQEKCLCSFAVREAKYYIGPFVLDQEQSSSVLMYRGENVLAAQRSIISSLLFRNDLLTNSPVRRAGRWRSDPAILNQVVRLSTTPNWDTM